MLPIHWRTTARNNLAKIIRYIAEQNPTAASDMLARLESAILPAAEHPYLYRAGRVPGTREVVAHPNYILVYRVTAGTVEVVNVLHARQEYPDSD
ncbi:MULTISPECIES: type II toxin-antitoxin system RelE/ParE family toxin [Pseudomonas]|uniref:Addiction module toxin, RelE/StbE family n=1 Tax=Pseudomonas lutea TaxID=243924 RepID=A0A9X8MHT5_9PSED|nr:MULTISPECIES: type II toxin-antitoxin system RelE/ParE family toxin [Pseudomonas]SER49059.1 addiction module toxin, RelE/StbE family [Pseudomonas lutea]